MTRPSCKHLHNDDKNIPHCDNGLSNRIMSHRLRGVDYCMGCSLYEGADDMNVKPPCKWLRENNSNNWNLWHCSYHIMNFRSIESCDGCKVYEPSSDEQIKESTQMKVCKYQNETNDCIKSSQRTFACVFARCNAWDAAEARCQYFEPTYENKLRNILCTIPKNDLIFIETVLKDNSEWVIEQIALSLSSRYDP